MSNTNTIKQTMKSGLSSDSSEGFLSGKHIAMIFAMLIALATSLATAQTAPLKEWDARFGGSGDDQLQSVQQTAEGGYILGGLSSSGLSGDKTQASQGNYDYWIVKTDANEVKQWDARFGGSSNDYLLSLQQTADGGYILGGRSYSGISGDRTQASQGGQDYWIVKTDANGVKQWDKRFGGGSDDQLFNVQQTVDGGYILGGSSVSGISGDRTQTNQGGQDFWLVKTDANGVKQWDVRFGGSSNDALLALDQTADGGYILGGESLSGLSGDRTQASQGAHDFWVVKTDANGVKQWDKRFGGNSEDLLNGLQQTADGGYIFGGQSLSGISGDKTQAGRGAYDYWIVKTDANGVKQWDAGFGGTSDESIPSHSLQQTADGGYILGGLSGSGISGDRTQASQGGYDYWLVRTDANGVKQWDERFGGSSDDAALSLGLTADGGYIVGGWSYSGISGDRTQASRGDRDYWIVKVASECNGGSTVYADADGDSYGDITNTLFVGDCIAPSGYVYNNTDCNDGNVSVHPGATEVTNGIDDNCNGIIDDGVCPSPANPSVTKITGTSAKLKWDAVAGAEGYTVRYKVANTNGWKYGTTYNNSKPISGLLPNTVYKWQVQTFCHVDPPYIMSDWSSKQEFTTLTESSGADQYFTVPEGVTQITVKLWGAGGAGGNYSGTNDMGGGGGFVTGTITVTPGETLTIIEGGKGETGAGPGAYGGGGGKANGVGGRGGGRSAVVRNGDDIITAGGGGGGGGGADLGDTVASGGGGGGVEGTASYWVPYNGEPGTNTGPGAGGNNPQHGCFTCGSNPGIGHNGGYAGAWDNGYTGSGGGGYFGGGSGTDIGDGGGGGGSGLVPAGGYSEQGNTLGIRIPGGTSDPDYPGNNIGYGGGKGENGNDGAVIIVGYWPVLKLSQSNVSAFLQIYPNPGEDYTTIQFTLPQSSHIYIKVYDMSGKEITTLLDEDVEQGDHSLLLNTNHFPKGVYLVRMISEFGIENQKLIVQ